MSVRIFSASNPREKRMKLYLKKPYLRWFKNENLSKFIWKLFSGGISVRSYTKWRTVLQVVWQPEKQLNPSDLNLAVVFEIQILWFFVYRNDLFQHLTMIQVLSQWAENRISFRELVIYNFRNIFSQEIVDKRQLHLQV